MSLDFALINSHILPSFKSYAPSWIPGGKFEGVQYVVKNPRRADKAAGSFKVNTLTGVWKDYACQGISGGDPISLYAYVFTNDDQGEAAKALQKELNLDTPPPPPTKIKKEVWAPIIPVPNDASFPPKKFMNNKISVYHAYKNQLGEVMGFTCRVDYKDKKKDILPLTYCKDNTGKKQWKYKSFEAPRPIYGLDLLDNKPDAQVVVVEGEKCADFGNELFKDDNIVFIAWIGGSQGIKKINWKPLKSRKKVVFWPDADTHRYKEGHPQAGELLPFEEQPGAGAMTTIYNMVKDIIGKGRLVRPPEDKVNGWDVADCKGWSKGRILTFIKDHLEAFGSDTPQEERVYKPFQSLGYNSTNGQIVYYYLPKGTNKVTSLQAAGHSKMGLLQLAPIQYFEREYPNRTGANYLEAANSLMRSCENKGIYDPGKIRGRGAWFDDGKTVLHLGNYLVVNGRKHQVSNYKSDYIYESEIPTEDEKFNFKNPLPVEERKKIIKMCDLIGWGDKIDSKLLAGWVVLAPICGAIDWRPHIWLTGESGTGKTWIIENIINVILGKRVLFAAANSTEAGIRQNLKSDGTPVIFDEIETEDIQAFQRVQKIIELARQASSNKSANIIKGSATGSAMLYFIRSCFMFSSINPKISQQSDQSRIKVLKLVKRPNFVNEHMFQKLSNLVFDTLTDDYCMRLRSRIIKMIPIIRENIKIFTKVMEKQLKSKRHGDQYGTLLSGAFALVSDDIINEDLAKEYCSDVDWENEIEEKEITDQEKLINTLLQKLIKVGNDVQPIGKLIRDGGRLTNATMTPERQTNIESNRRNAIDILRKYGMSVVRNRNTAKYEVAFAWNYSLIKDLLKDTPWHSGYDIVLCRLTDAYKKKVVFADGRSQNAVVVPFEALFQESDDIYYYGEDEGETF